MTLHNWVNKNNKMKHTSGMSIAQQAPPNLQFICNAIFCVIDCTRSGLDNVLEIIT